MRRAKKVRDCIYNDLIECKVCGSSYVSQLTDDQYYYSCPNGSPAQELHKKEYIQENIITHGIQTQLDLLSRCSYQLLHVFLKEKDEDINHFIVYFAYHAHELFKQGNYERKREVVQFAFESLIGYEKNITENFHEIFFDIIINKDMPEEIISKLENAEIDIPFTIEELKSVVRKRS